MDPVRTPQGSDQFLPTQSGENRVSGELLAQAMAGILSKYQTALGYNNNNQPYDIQVVTVDLSTARTAGNPLRIGFPFRSYFVVSTTGGANASCSLQYSTQDSFAQGIPLSLKDSGVLEFPVRQAFITNAAQTGTMTILFSVTTEFRSGSQVSVSAGGVSISEGTTVTNRAVTGLTLTTLTASELLPSDTSRKVESVQNNTSQTLWLGDANVTASGGTYPGIQLNPGDVFIWKNTAALYAYNPGATLSDANISRVLET